MTECDSNRQPDTDQTNEQTRNDFILDVIDKGLLPILPFESTILSEQIGSYSLEQERLGKLLGEAMSQSSETWHDNAPADAINSESVVLSSQAETKNRILGNSVSFDYPSPANQTVTLGSIVEIIYGGDSVSEIIYITGVTRDIEAINKQTGASFPIDTGVVTVSSPLGQSLLSANKGDVRTYVANGREHTVQVLTIIQEKFKA